MWGISRGFHLRVLSTLGGVRLSDSKKVQIMDVQTTNSSRLTLQRRHGEVVSRDCIPLSFCINLTMPSIRKPAGLAASSKKLDPALSALFSESVSKPSLSIGACWDTSRLHH
jgi:hypothetical protein